MIRALLCHSNCQTPGSIYFSDFSIDEILSALVDEGNSLEFFELFLELVYSLK